jgi:hypothetical protein
VPYPRFADPSHPGTSYSVDGMPVPVDYFMQMVDFAFHGSLGLAEASARASRRIVGYRNRGLRFGQEFDVTYDTHGRITSESWGSSRDPGLASYSIETPIYDNSWSFAIALLPQNTGLTTNEIDNFKSKIENVLTDPCKDFIKAVLNRVAASTKTDLSKSGGDLMNLFETVRAQKGFVWDKSLPRDAIGQARGSIGGEDALIALNNSDPTTFARLFVKCCVWKISGGDLVSLLL